MSTSSYDFLVEEEAQVVPSSLDHLSRHELCHMIYRLDYERHTLKEKLVALRLAVSASNVGVGRGGGRRRTKQQPTTSTLEKRSRQGKKKACSDDDNEEEKVAKMQKTNNDSDESIQQEPTTLEEINAIHKRLTQTVISEIKVTTHGGLLRPRTTAEENDISLTTAMHIMQHWGDKLTHDTKRMIKWEFTSSSSSSSCEDNDIAKFLQCEKYLRGVRHNGKGFLVGSIGNNGSSFTQFAKFESMIVSYDKLTMMMKVQVSTRGCNEKGIS